MRRAAVFSITDEYVMPFQVMLHSLISTQSIPCESQVFILHSDSLSFESIAKLRTYLLRYQRSFVFIDCSDAIPTSLPNLSTISESSYYRLFITELLPSDIDYAVYFDSDMICISSCRDLFELTSSKMIMAVDHCAPWHELRLWGEGLGNYFQAGLLVIPLYLWRSRDVLTSFLKVIGQYGETLSFHDQDVLNICFRDDWDRLPLGYNVDSCLLSAFPFSELKRRTYILHFSGKNKPWSSYSGNMSFQLWADAYHSTFEKSWSSQQFREPLLKRFFKPSFKSRLRGLLFGG